MTKKLRTELVDITARLAAECKEMADVLADVVNRIDRLEERLDRLGPPRMITTEEAWATPAPSRWRRLLNGSWPLLDGNIYPPVRGQGPLGGYEPYVRRSPPATE